MKLNLLLPALFCMVVLAACTSRLESRFLTAEELRIQPETYDAPAPPTRRSLRDDPCYNPANYQPDTTHLDHYFTKYLRVNVHWMNSSDSSQNLYGEAARAVARGLIRAANRDLERNHKLWLPHGNELPVLPLGYRYLITGRPEDPDDDGIYFHFDDELYYYVHINRKDANLYKRDVFNRYGVQLDTVLNIFLMPHHPDSVASKTYPEYDVGVALGNAFKLAATWRESYQQDTQFYWRMRGVLNHEIGHILSLGHAWIGDGCDDTPHHTQACFCRDGSAKCDTLASNNVMDYNCVQHAWSPCQIGKIQQRLADERFLARKLLEPRWCTRRPEADITIRDSVLWNCMKDLEGDLVIAEGGHLTVQCRLNLPAGARITVQPGGSLVLENCRLFNDCGYDWQGIEIQERGNQKGRVEMVGDVRVENVALGPGDT